MRRLFPLFLILLALGISSRLCGDVYIRGSDMGASSAEASEAKGSGVIFSASENS